MAWLTIPASVLAPEATLHLHTEGDSGPLVVLLHELGGSTRTWQSIAYALSARYRVAAFDQRGSGLSEKPMRGLTMEVFADDLAAVCRALAPGGKAIVAGLAMGAVTALHAAARHPKAIAALALISPAAAIVDSARAYLYDRAALVERQGMRAALESSFANAFPAFCRDSAEATEYRHRFLSNSPQAYAATSRALARFGGYTLGDVACPALLVSGRHDFIWPPEHGAALAGDLDHAHAAVIEDSGHFPPLQAPAACLRLIEPFLADHT
jgi:3-oxoadipate enol-lactonase